MANRSGPSLVALLSGNSNERRAIGRSIEGFYHLSEYDDARTTLEGLKERPPRAVIVDELFPPCGAYDFITMMREDPILYRIPALVLSPIDPREIREAILKCGGNGYLPKPWNTPIALRLITGAINKCVEREWSVLAEKEQTALKEILGAIKILAGSFQTGEAISADELKSACAPVVELIYENRTKSVLDAVRDHDNYTFAHSFSVGTMLAMFGCALDLNDGAQILLATGGLVHDVGKMAIPLDILNKPGKLTPDEWTVLKGHVSTAKGFLDTHCALPQTVRVIAEQHHEKLDGSGYPRGISGRDLNELARMAAIVDVYCALTDRRAYKVEMLPEKALDLMAKEMTGQLDSWFLARFREMILDQLR